MDFKSINGFVPVPFFLIFCFCGIPSFMKSARLMKLMFGKPLLLPEDSSESFLESSSASDASRMSAAVLSDALFPSCASVVSASLFSFPPPADFCPDVPFDFVGSPYGLNGLFNMFMNIGLFIIC